MTASPDSARVAGAVRAEQIRTLYSHQPLSLGGTTAVALMAWFVLDPAVERGPLATWMTVVVALIASRALLYLRFRRQAVSDAAIDGWAWAALSLALASGIAWAALPILFIDGHHPFTMINTIVFCVGMLAGSLISQSVYLPAYFCFSVPLALALSVSVHVNGGPHSELAWLGYVFSAVIMAFCVNSNRVFRQSIETRFENARLVEELRLQKREADSANHAKSQFLAAASHDLRQPLHSLGLYAGALGDAASTPEQHVLTGRMAVAIKSLNHLFQHILEISKLDAGVVVPEVRDIPLRDVLGQLELRYTTLAEGQGLAFECRYGDENVRSDPVLLERIVDNLLANAFRYTDRGHVRLIGRADGDQVGVEISDSGRGIPESERDNIFREFYQLDNPERDRQKGLGLGLSIVRRLSRLLGHSLDFSSRQGEGTQFRLTLARGDSDASANRVATPQSFDWELDGTRVLVIDDEEAVRDAMRAQLESWGCHVVAVEGAASVGQHLDQVPGLIIADYRLRANESGIDAVRALRERFGETIPAVLVTGDTAPERLREARASGLRVLHKPVNPGQLRMVVNRLVSTRR